MGQHGGGQGKADSFATPIQPDVHVEVGRVCVWDGSGAIQHELHVRWGAVGSGSGANAMILTS